MLHVTFLNTKGEIIVEAMVKEVIMVKVKSFALSLLVLPSLPLLASLSK